MRDLSVAELNELNLNMVFDYIYAYDDYKFGNSENHSKKNTAGQAEFDAF